ncbi:hypothetical protein LOH54_05050 [Sulfurimonas sp. HSL-3221]|uniref:hypothetical protein n=1 Tax=Sulfurimonadaceae TaxID=2771471 RepID=UPI001E38785F|nr:hypothetical protein [Sulfurimonas sp. HSL-3221]UFS63499.1 hypothetical protein LOH54_05050 [Sulfurimonas sp. HSL-3221]
MKMLHYEETRTMFKPIIDRLNANGLIYKNLDEVQPKALGIRNRIRLFSATDRQGYYTAIFVVAQKSRVVMKDVEKLDVILRKLELYADHAFKHRVLMIDAPLCSKAKAAFKQQGWKLI